MTLAPELYWDPFDTAIDADPYETWRRLRDEQPVYRNDRHDFYALSRYADVEAAHRDPATYSSAHGTVLEIMTERPMPSAMMIFLDPPDHTRLRSLVNRAFTPRRVAHLEDRIRTLCADFLGGLAGRRAVRLRAGLRRPAAGDGDRHPARRPRARPAHRARADRHHVPPRPREGDDQRRLADGPHRAAPVPRGPRGEAARRPAGRHDQRPDGRRADRPRRRGPAAHALRGRHVRRPAGQRGHRDRRPPARLGRRAARRAPRPAGRSGRAPRRDPQRHRGAAALRGTFAGPGPVADAATSSCTASTDPGRLEGAPAHRFGRARRAQVPRRRPLRRAPGLRPPRLVRLRRSTSASAPRWPGWRVASRSRRSWPAGPSGRSTTTPPSACTPARCGAGSTCR